MNNDDFSKFADKFVDDSHNLLNELEGKLLELEQDTSNQELIEAVFRAMHTLKGIGGMFGFDAISAYTHHLETIYDKIREGFLAIDKSIFEVTFASVDHLRNLLGDQDVKDPQLAARHSELTQQLENLAKSKQLYYDQIKTIENTKKTKETIQMSTWYIQFTCSEELIRRAVNITYMFQDLAKIGTYTIFKHTGKLDYEINEQDEVWGILLTSNVSYSEIEEVFMFVSDFVKIARHSNFDTNTQEAELDKKKEHLSIFELAQSAGEKLERGDALPDPAEMTNEQQILRRSSKIPRISVGADKLDKLMFLVGELFTTRSELVIASQSDNMAQVKLATEKIDRLSSQLRKNALSIRLVPLRELTLKFKRLIRDLSSQLNKNIDFEIQGDDTELDKNLVDNLADPFMHIIRNCIDHGIESPEERNAKHKPENGIIRFTAYQSGNYIYIQISDDGRGIDRDYIRTKAVEKGFVQHGTQLNDREMLDLIFMPGFSTAESLTQVSGRGVGMDVVKRAITDLRGSVEIETEKGKGTTFTIKLQQTIAIMDTLLIRSGDSYFTIILEEVEVCELENHQTFDKRQNSHVQIADDLIPYVSLRQAFSIEGTTPETERIIVIKRPNLHYAIVADSIVGQYQAVIKPLGSLLKRKEYLSGASIMGDGNIAFMLDTQKLCSKIA